MNPNDTDGHQVGNGLGAEQPNTFAPNTGAIPNTVTSEAFSALQQNTFTPNTGDAFNAPQAPIISSSPDPEDKRENSITRAFGGRPRASKIAAQAPVQPSNLRQNAPDFFQQSMQQQDIVLSNEVEQKAKGKKGLIIGGIIGGVAFIALTAATIAVISGSNSANTTLSQSIVDKFNILGNYIMLGEEKTDKLTEIDSIYDYNISKISTSDNQEHFARVKELFDDYYSELKNQNLASDNELIQKSDTMKTHIELANFIYSDKLDDSDVIAFYFEKGEEQSLDYIESYYANLSIGNSSYLKSLTEYQQNLIKQIAYSTQMGCNSDASDGHICDPLENDLQFNDIIKTQQALSEEITDSETNAIISLKEEIKIISAEIEKQNAQD